MLNVEEMMLMFADFCGKKLMILCHGMMLSVCELLLDLIIVFTSASYNLLTAVIATRAKEDMSSANCFTQQVSIRSFHIFLEDRR